MSRCIIIAPLYDGCERELLRPREGDCLICADGGYAAAVRFGLRPELVIGDFDSMPPRVFPGCEVLRLPVHKDDTDLEVCLRAGAERGYSEFVIAGAIGGRLDHTIAALQAAKAAALQGYRVTLVDACNRLSVLTPGSYDLSSPAMEDRFLSLLAATDRVTGITLTGAEWELDNAELTSADPIGTSNRVTGRPMLRFETGLLYLIRSEDKKTK